MADNKMVVQNAAPEFKLKDRKRQHKYDDPEVPEAKKTAGEVDTISTEFSDLNVDCLEHVFGYLGFADLLNVVDLNANAADAAKIVYSRHYSKRQIRIWSPDLNGLLALPQIMGSAIKISSAADCSKLLLHFGGLIEKLELFSFISDALTQDWIDVMHLISIKCGESLLELKLNNCNERISNEFQSVFEKVESFHVQRSHVGKFKQLDEWFPCLKRLNLADNGPFITINMTSPTNSVWQIKEECLSLSEIKSMIKAAPELEALSLTGVINADLLRFINDNQPMLKHLSLPQSFFSNQPGVDKVVFESVKSFSIEPMQSNISPANLPLTFQRLTELEVTVNTLGREWIDFAIGHSELVKLRLEMPWCEACVANLLSQCKSLRTLRILERYQHDYQDLSTQFSNGWHIAEDGDALVFERKLACK